MSLFNMSRSRENGSDDKPEVTSRQETPTTRAREVMLPVDIFEGPDELLLLADLPGVEASGLNVSFDAQELRIEGRRDAGESAVVYTRTFRVNEHIDASNITAELASGVLKLRLPKSPATKPRKIEVRAA